MALQKNGALFRHDAAQMPRQPLEVDLPRLPPAVVCAQEAMLHGKLVQVQDLLSRPFQNARHRALSRPGRSGDCYSHEWLSR